eukprot:2717625-Ditylum_brightwellii.AAC.1
MQVWQNRCIGSLQGDSTKSGNIKREPRSPSQCYPGSDRFQDRYPPGHDGKGERGWKWEEGRNIQG